MIKKKYVILKKIFFNLYTRKTHLYKKKNHKLLVPWTQQRQNPKHGQSKRPKPTRDLYWVWALPENWPRN
jgi:hypothetical protein